MTVKALGRGTIFVCLMEDMPYPENRVVLDDNEADGVRLKYTIKDELRHRVTQFRRLLTEASQGTPAGFSFTGCRAELRAPLWHLCHER